MLHIINQSPFQSTALSECLRFATQQDVILLIEDGVYAATGIDFSALAITVYALQDDIAARGLTGKVASTVKTIDYAGFVDLTLAHTPIQTWS